MTKLRKLFSQGMVNLSEVLPKLAWLLVIVAAYIKGDDESKGFLKRIKRERQWYKANGDSTFLIDYSLDEKSVVFDVGGYIGNSAASIYCKFGSTIHIFEPVKVYIDRLESRFGENKKIFLHEYGVGGETTDLEIFISEGGTSLFSNHINYKSKELIKINSLKDVLQKLNVIEIDLISINIEGAEYALLEHAIDNNLLINIRYIQVQFHDISDDSICRRELIRDKLKLTHSEKYCFPFVWEAWERVDS